ncbi:uncharacterized protein [Linepithema humile]|uniref:uncharacterized protein isoform X2 n=1 Tax=Linepithema humile TaxID=83485 RepID=UPI00351F79E4
MWLLCDVECLMDAAGKCRRHRQRLLQLYNSAVTHRVPVDRGNYQPWLTIVSKGRPTSGAAPTSHGHGGGSCEGGEGQNDCSGKRDASFPMESSRSLKEASDVISTRPVALQVSAVPSNPEQYMQ